jgi:hypothetical protein
VDVEKELGTVAIGVSIVGELDSKKELEIVAIGVSIKGEQDVGTELGTVAIGVSIIGKEMGTGAISALIIGRLNVFPNKGNALIICRLELSVDSMMGKVSGCPVEWTSLSKNGMGCSFG